MNKTIRILLTVIAFAGNSFAQGKTYGTQISGLVAIPTGRFSDSFSTGFGGFGAMFYDLETYARLTLSGGYTTWSVNNDGITEQYEEQNGDGTISASGHIAAIPLLIGIQLITPGPMRMYGTLEGGLYLYSVDVSATITDQNGVTSNVPLDNSFRSEPAFVLGGGVLFPLQETTSLDVAARYHFVNNTDVSTSSASTNIGTSQYFSLSIGLNYSFPLPQ